MSAQKMVITLYGRRFLQPDWQVDFDRESMSAWISQLADEYAPFQIEVVAHWQEEILLEVRGYADLLNSVRLRSEPGNTGNLCLGHIIGKSAHCHLEEDLRRAVSRMAFAPETIEPDGENKRVCHNCGCGC